jgi:site-specific recombinase XerD
MKSAGVSPAIVLEFVGHDSKAVSQIFTHIDTETLRRAAEGLPDIGGGTDAS